MAMRGRGRINPSRPRLISGRVYENFKPMSEWRQEDDYDTLLVYLPGFHKEYIKVTTEDLNMVRVRGERLISDNKWSRFQEDYRVPENCEMRGIRAKFDGGILTITMPRKITNAPPPPPITQLAPNDEKPDKNQTTPLDVPSTTSTQRPPTTKDQPFGIKKQEEPKEKKLAKPDQTTPYTLPPQPKPTSSYNPTKEEATEEKEAVAESLPSIGEKTDLKQRKGDEALVEEETRRDANKVVARSWMVSEDRKALVNVSVGVLVIVAIGVHVSYTIGLISKGA